MPNRMDSMISKGAGMVKAVKARLEGLVGVFKTLAEQHGEVAALLKRLQHSPDKRSELWPEIRRELLSHERAELREVYAHRHVRCAQPGRDRGDEPRRVADLQRVADPPRL